VRRYDRTSPASPSHATTDARNDIIYAKNNCSQPRQNKLLSYHQHLVKSRYGIVTHVRTRARSLACSRKPRACAARALVSARRYEHVWRLVLLGNVSWRLDSKQSELWEWTLCYKNSWTKLRPSDSNAKKAFSLSLSKLPNLVLSALARPINHVWNQLKTNHRVSTHK
jgi:hypothetical protein